MAKKKSSPKGNLVRAVHPVRPTWDYYLPKENKALIAKLQKKFIFPKTCEKPCTKVITLLPKSNVGGISGMGYHMINVDGFRTMNAYVISDPLNSSSQRGFTLELSFSVNDFVYGVGVIGETSNFFNFESYFNPGVWNQATLRCETSDLTTTGGLIPVPWVGGTDLTHILRTPVMGPYVRAAVFNEDSTARNVEVKAYLST